ncbi:MAG: phage shock protein [Patescibacteria group bacterium]|jgi:rhodanese-related sulfurtransferase|nr:phage shock protein [Patescibacteria group bacterium]
MIYIDVRTKGEYDSGHKDGALNHDIMEMMEGKFPNLPKDSEIILYCESGNRSMMAKGMMEGVGFTNITNGGSYSDVA